MRDNEQGFPHPMLYLGSWWSFDGWNQIVYLIPHHWLILEQRKIKWMSSSLYKQPMSFLASINLNLLDILSSGKLLRERTFVNLNRENLHGLLAYPANGCHAPKFCKKAFVSSHKTSKFAKVFSLESIRYPLPLHLHVNVGYLIDPNATTAVWLTTFEGCSRLRSCPKLMGSEFTSAI